MSIVRLHGEDAIEYAKKHALTLNADATGDEGPKHHLTPKEAEAIARENPSAVWLEVETDVNTAGHE